MEKTLKARKHIRSLTDVQVLSEDSSDFAEPDPATQLITQMQQAFARADFKLD
jgi:hypothetical protein